MDATQRIKNLSIALEALSRIPKVDEHFEDVEALLSQEIFEEKERREPRPAKSTLTDEDDNFHS